MKKLNAYQKIQQGIKDNEKRVIDNIKYSMKRGEGYYHTFGLWSIETWHAIERLEKKGKVKFSKKLHGYILVK